ncbi:MAG: hypothetical protein ISR85_01380 [Kiritimatiellales bacterium]|nr:hypothetical protein [Kiritimatiellota bacterium]MBL7011565.1 hypothetical protein [Kiritimatiellales bacterium]
MKTKMILGLLIFSLPLFGCASLRYETSHYSDSVKLFSGETITLNEIITSPRGTSVPFIFHGYISFGKKHTYEYSFEYANKTISMKSDEIWLLLNKYEGDFYIWTKSFFTEKLSNSKLYRYNTKNSKWDRIDRAEFPKSIAVKNLNLWEKAGTCDAHGIINDKEIARKLNPNDHHFVDSLTAHLWLMLETGTFLEKSHWDVDSEFLKQFKENYIKQPVPIAD